MKIYSLDELKKWFSLRDFILITEREDMKGHRERQMCPVLGVVEIDDKNTLKYTYRDRDSQEITSMEFEDLEWTNVKCNEVCSIVIEVARRHNGFRTIYTFYEA